MISIIFLLFIDIKVIESKKEQNYWIVMRNKKNHKKSLVVYDSVSL